MSYKTIDFSKLNGYGFTQQTLAFMQDAYNAALTGLAKLAGDAVIISGMEENGGTVSNGWILINGELLPFTGGAKQNYFIVQEVPGDRKFNDNTSKSVWKTRTARFGSGANQVLYSSLTRLDDLKTLNSSVHSLADSLNTISLMLGGHISNDDNPHSVTKSQIGLSNIPNAKSNSFMLDDANTLATSKALRDGLVVNQRIIYAGTYYMGNISPHEVFYIPHNQNIIALDYIVAGTLRSTAPDVRSDDNVIWMVRDLRSNTFGLVVHEVSATTQNLYFDYILIRR